MEATPTIAEAYARAARAQGVILNVRLLRERFRAAYTIEEEKDRRDGTLETDEGNERRRCASWSRPSCPKSPTAIARSTNYGCISVAAILGERSRTSPKRLNF